MGHFGYVGSILKVDLSTGEIRRRDLPQDLVKGFLGGLGINLKLYREEAKPLSDPLSPTNPLVLGAGPLVGTEVPGATKLVATTKSPIFSRGGKHFVDGAVCGGRLGVQLKRAGYDHVVIVGKAEEPVYLNLENGRAELLDASALWGKDTYETTEWLLREHPGAGLAVIGRAGERRVRHAMAIVDRVATLGRFGVGAVMGSKHLKAVVARGEGRIAVAKEEELSELVKKWREDIEKNPLLPQWRVLGIAAGWPAHSPLVREGVWEYSKWNELYGPETWLKFKGGRNSSCWGCPMGCRVDFHIGEGKHAGLSTFTGSYMLPARVGQRLELEDPRDAVALLDLCNREGMCYFTTSQLVNWVTRLSKTGKLKEKLERNFETYRRLFKEIAEREGFGGLLSDGWYPASEKLGADPDEFEEGTGLFRGVDAIQDARFTRLHPQAFSHLTSPRPHHGGTQSLYTVPMVDPQVLREVDAKEMGLSEGELDRIFGGPMKFNPARYARYAEDRMVIYNSLGTCIVHALWGFLGIKYLNLNLAAELYSLVTGFEVGVEELRKKGERIFTFWKMLNAEEGLRKEDYKCSKIWLIPRKTPEGEVLLRDYYGEVVLSEKDMENLLKDYYEERGWDGATGLPTPQKLRELGLEGEGFRLPAL
ncbi:MAG: aldehyde ferredoxin oxidoreductase N-terminal domain-containing protein [Candidatus Hadarchaeales archaeon]